MKLIPVDKKQCQCEITSYEPWHFGGCPYQVKRCENKPKYIIIEKKKNPKYGKKGSMSVCTRCFKECEKKFGKNFFVVKEIK